MCIWLEVNFFKRSTSTPLTAESCHHYNRVGSPALPGRILMVRRIGRTEHKFRVVFEQKITENSKATMSRAQIPTRVWRREGASLELEVDKALRFPEFIY